MRILYTLGTLVLILFSAPQVFSAPVPAGQSVNPARVTHPPVPTAQTPPVILDGYQKTNQFFQVCKKKAAETETFLKKIQAESVTLAPDDKTRQRTLFLKKLTERYPGADFDGTSGTAPFNEHFVVCFNGALQVVSIKEMGDINLEYLVTQGRIVITSGVNTVTILIDQQDPSRSTFINVTLPEIKAVAEEIVTDPDRKSIAADTAESAILNDAYQLLHLTNSQRMDVFAVDIIREESARNEALRVAAKGYQERHRQDYQAADPTKIKKKVAQVKINKFTEKRYYDGILKWLLFILSAAALVGLVIIIIRPLRARAAKKLNKKLVGKYGSLSPKRSGLEKVRCLMRYQIGRGKDERTTRFMRTITRM